MGSLAMCFTLVGGGAYFHGVLINTCNFLVYSVQLFGNKLAAIFIDLEGFFLLISVQCLKHFLEPEIQSAIDCCQPILAANFKNRHRYLIFLYLCNLCSLRVRIWSLWQTQAPLQCYRKMAPWSAHMSCCHQ